MATKAKEMTDSAQPKSDDLSKSFDLVPQYNEFDFPEELLEQKSDDSWFSGCNPLSSGKNWIARKYETLFGNSDDDESISDEQLWQLLCEWVDKKRSPIVVETRTIPRTTTAIAAAVTGLVIGGPIGLLIGGASGLCATKCMTADEKKISTVEDLLDLDDAERQKIIRQFRQRVKSVLSSPKND